MTGAELYADLRKRGEVVIGVDDKGAIVGARRLAKADGFVVSQFRRTDRQMSSAQRRRAPYSVALTLPGSDLIVFPDRSAAV